MSVATVSFGFKMDSMEFVLDYDPKYPQDFDPITDDFDRRDEREYYRITGYYDGRHSVVNRADECPHFPPGIQQAYNEGFAMGSWHQKVFNSF